MSDQEIRALERQLQSAPDDETTAIKLFNSRRRAGFAVESIFILQNSKTGRFYHFWSRYPNITDVAETATLDAQRRTRNGIFASREAVLKEVKRLQRNGVAVDHFRIVELQTMTMEVPGPLVGDIKEQIDVELLQAKKETQLRKLKKIEIEEQALLEQKKKAEQEKLKKLEAKEVALQKKIAAKGKSSK